MGGKVYKKQVSEKIHFMSKNGICFTYNLLLILADFHIIGGGSCQGWNTPKGEKVHIKTLFVSPMKVWRLESDKETMTRQEVERLVSCRGLGRACRAGP